MPDSDMIEEIKKALPSDEKLYEVSELFKVFGDKTRAKILSTLAVSPLYVSDIAEAVGMSVSAVSHQLRVLRTAQLVRGVKEGKEVRYALDDEHVKEILDCGLEHVGELH